MKRRGQAEIPARFVGLIAAFRKQMRSGKIAHHIVSVSQVRYKLLALAISQSNRNLPLVLRPVPPKETSLAKPSR